MSHDSSLEPVLRTVEPAVRLVPVRHLRQVLNYLIDRGHPLPTNTDLPFWVSRDDLIAADILPGHVLTGDQPRILLVTDPDDRLIEHLPRAEQLLVYWRVLLRAAVIAEFERLQGTTGGLAADTRLDQFGPAVSREIEYVLRSEHSLHPDQSGAATFHMFAAAYLDFVTFEPHVLSHYFPSLPVAEVDRVVRRLIDVPTLIERSRPSGAAEPRREHSRDSHLTSAQHTATRLSQTVQTSQLIHRAEEAAGQGNTVRAAILFTQATAATGSRSGEAATSALASLRKLVEALGHVFAWNDDTRQEWHQALVPLLDLAATGEWPRAARCLYELQTLSADLTREVYAIDLPESIRTFGRRPVKRQLPHAKPVRILMALKKAHGQLIRAGLTGADQLRLDRLFHHQLHTVEHDIRRDFTPIIADALTRAGLVPSNVVEEVARDKLVSELLDRVCDRGYLRIGDLRDAIARNRLKMRDTPSALFTGDALLRADVSLAYALDGVYRKGEAYLRGLQRFSALFFANPIGRLVTLFVALPFGGAFLTLMFAEEMRHIGEKVVTALKKPAVASVAGPVPGRSPAVVPVKTDTVTDVIRPDEVLDVDDEGWVIVRDGHDGTRANEDIWVDDDGAPLFRNPTTRVAIVREVFNAPGEIPTRAPEHHGSGLTAWPTIICLGTFLLLMIHVTPFRRVVFKTLNQLWRCLRTLAWDFPLRVWRSDTVRELRQSVAVRFLFRHFWSPLLISLMVFGVLLLVGLTTTFLWRWGPYIWAALTIAYNTPWGWVVQDRVTEALSDWWRVVRVNLLPGLVQTIIDWFRMLANWIERKLYAVDEWFRFRGGDSRGSIATKAVLGLVWFPIAYVFRFAFYLLVEPQVNPIKHFPVVTVSHKMLLPLVVSKDPQAEPSIFGELLVNQFGLGVAEGNFWAFWIIAGIPGIFGFMAWEFVANWQLYRANRSPRLRPVTIGSHGETMRGLLRPGFHSGTVPKLYRKLRRASSDKMSRYHGELEHASEAVHRFIERELLHLLARCPEWVGVEIRVGSVNFGCRRVVVSLAAETLSENDFRLAIENTGEQIEADIEQRGWAEHLNDLQRDSLVAALRGVLDMAAVDRVFGLERSEEPTPVIGFADLVRRVTYVEWAGLWREGAGMGKPKG